MKQDPFKEYLRQTEPDIREKGYIWQTAVGLQAVDGLTPSKLPTPISNGGLIFAPPGHSAGSALRGGFHRYH